MDRLAATATHLTLPDSAADAVSRCTRRSRPIDIDSFDALAALPVLVLFGYCAGHKPAPIAGAAGAATAFLSACSLTGMSPRQAGLSFVHGAASACCRSDWTVLNAMLLYNIKSSRVNLPSYVDPLRDCPRCSCSSNSRRLLVRRVSRRGGRRGHAGRDLRRGSRRLGFEPIRAAVLCLIANTSPVAYGASASRSSRSAM